MRSITDAIIVSLDLATDVKNAVMVVGRKRKNESLEIINAFQGEEAVELYNRLTTVKKGADES